MIKNAALYYHSNRLFDAHIIMSGQDFGGDLCRFPGSGGILLSGRCAKDELLYLRVEGGGKDSIGA